MCQYPKFVWNIIFLNKYSWEESMYKRIRELREDRDLLQKDLAKYLNCTQVTYSRYELGQRDIPTAILIKLADFYNVSIDYLLERTDEPKMNKKAK